MGRVPGYQERRINKIIRNIQTIYVIKMRGGDDTRSDNERRRRDEDYGLCPCQFFYQQPTKCKPPVRPAYNDLGTKSVWSDGGDSIENGKLELHLKSKSDIPFPRIPVTWMGWFINGFSLATINEVSLHVVYIVVNVIILFYLLLYILLWVISSFRVSPGFKRKYYVAIIF